MLFTVYSLSFEYHYLDTKIPTSIWSEMKSIKCPKLTELSSSLPNVLEAGLASSTNKKYYTGWKRWLDWCTSNPEVEKLPGKPFFVALYLNHVLSTFNTKGAIISAFYGIRWGHSIAGLTSPTDHPFVKLAFEGCQRLVASNRKQPKDPISPELLKLFFKKFDSENLYELRFLVLCFIGFAGFFRIEELLATKIKHLSFKESHLEIYLEKSKCDQHRDGNVIFISRLQTEYCPVKLLEKFLRLGNISDKDSFLIPRLFKTKKGYVASKTIGISYTRAREIFLEKLKELNVTNHNFGLHSLRAGGATAAAENNVNGRLISKHGRWSSEKSKNGYIKDSANKRLMISKSLGI